MWKPNVVVREDEVLTSLSALRTERADFEDAARYGEWARASAHPMDAPGHGGHDAWNMRIRRLGIRLQSHGYRRVDHRGVPFVYNADLKIAITTASGNEDTANPARHPKTLFPKGGVAITLAARNRREQPDLDGFVYTGRTEPTPVSLPVDVCTFYMLVDRRGGSIFVELSEPVRIDNAGYVVEWNPRIILGSFPVGEPADINDEDDDDGSSTEVEVSPRGR
jgi:hypothetical protein